MRIGSLCSGYGGLDLAVGQHYGAETAWFCEYDKAPSRILAHHWPDAPNHRDITTVDWSLVEPVDILTAGYPCQPFSHAGKRKGSKDERHIWPDVARAISDLRPRVIVLENVRGHVSLGLDAVLGDLAGLGYDAWWGVVRAADAGAAHNRARVFIVATDTSGERHGGGENTAGVGRVDRTDAGQAREREWPRGLAQHRSATAPTDANGSGSQGREPAAGRDVSTWGTYAPAIARWEHVIGRPAPAPTEPGKTGNPRLAPPFVEWLMGLPAGHVTDPTIGLTRNQQLKALGNGVVPQQARLALGLLTEEAR